MRIIKLFFFVCCCLCIAVLPGCRNGKRNNTTIFTGSRTELGHERIGKAGGEIVIEKAGDPLDGLIIQVPENAFENNRDFAISYEEIKDHKLGKYFNPVSPLITISNGGGYSNELMTLTIPVNIAPDEFAMAFFYDPETGRLEGIPLLESDGKKVVVATRRFSDKSINKDVALAMQAAPPAPDEMDKIILTAAKEKDIRGDFNTGFDPGEDDFPSVNYGSTVAPKGHCEGQSLAAMWYHSEKTLKEKKAPLYQLLDNEGGEPTPKFWQDDVSALKFASMVQTDYDYTILFRLFLRAAELYGQVPFSDRLTMNAFRYAILLTNEPQFVGIFPNDPRYGHALIAYKIKNNALLVADPNFPGDKRNKIQYTESEKLFSSYMSGGTAANLGTAYSHIFYLGKSACFGWPTVEKHWKDLEDGKVGNGEFPEFTIVAMNKDVEFEPIEDGFNVYEGRLKLNARGGRYLTEVYGNRGNPLVFNIDGYYEVPSGKQSLGIVVLDENKRWVGFKRVNVVAEGGELAPPTSQRPTYGQVFLDLYVDGVKIPIDTTGFQLSLSAKYFGLRAYGFKPNQTDEDYLRDNIHVEVEGCNGLGIYNNATTTWHLGASDGSRYTATSGTVQIMRWAPAALEGSFSFTVTEQNVVLSTPKVKKIEGTFRYKGGYDNF